MPNERHSEPLTVRELRELAGRPPTSAEESELLWARTAEQRISAMYRGELTLNQLCEWSSRRPSEVPRAADGEFLWIAWTTPEWCEPSGS